MSTVILNECTTHFREQIAFYQSTYSLHVFFQQTSKIRNVKFCFYCFQACIRNTPNFFHTFEDIERNFV